MKRKANQPVGPYEAPDTRLVLFETGNALCDTSAESGEIEPGTLDSWGNF